MCFSFIYTEKTVTIVKESDLLMTEIKQEKDKYYVKPINSIINDQYIIPGLNGKEVDVDKSYEIIKKVGKYSPNLLVYKDIKPELSILNNYDKYIISGNQNKKEVTLIFKGKKIDNIINILETNNITSSFLIDNNQNIQNLINTKHIIIDNNKNIKQKTKYCYTEQDNNDLLKKCSKQKKYTIKPSIITNKNPFIEIKNNLKNGSIISLEINQKLEKELPIIIKYINSKGYIITNLEEFIKE